MSVISNFFRHLSQYGDKTAFEYQGLNFSYRWLVRHSAKTANWLAAQNVSCLGFALANSPLSALLYLGAWQAGVDSCPINPRLTAHEIMQIMSRLSIDCLIVDVSQCTEELNNYCHEHSIELMVADEAFDESTCFQLIAAEADEARFVYASSITYHLSSGSEGFYKSHAHNSAQIIEYAYARATDMGYRSNDKLLMALSINHAYAFSYQFLPSLAMGLTTHLLPTYCCESVVHALQTQEITATALLPVMVHDLIEHAFKAPHWRLPLVAGDYLSQDLVTRFRQRFALPLFNGIGMTEVYGYAQNTTSQSNPNRIKLFERVKAFIKPLTPPLRINDKEVGELMLDCGMQPINCAEGALPTGDLAYLENGYVTICGRKKELIIKGGSNIAPLELEELIIKHPFVKKVSVLGVADARWGQKIMVVVCLAPTCDLSLQELQDYLKPYLAQYKWPDVLRVLDAWPTNVTGKLSRKALKQFVVCE